MGLTSCELFKRCDDFFMELYSKCYFNTDSGFKLDVHRWNPTDAVSGVVYLFHCIGSSLKIDYLNGVDQKYNASWIQFLCNAGNVVIGCDLPGHGNSEGDFNETNIDESVRECVSFILESSNEFDNVDIHLCGISTGALLALQVSCWVPLLNLKTITLLSPPFKILDENFSLYSDLPCENLVVNRISNPHIFDWLTFVSTVNPLFKPFPTNKKFYDSVLRLAKLTRDIALGCKVKLLILYSSDDPLCDSSTVLNVFLKYFTNVENHTEVMLDGGWFWITQNPFIVQTAASICTDFQGDHESDNSLLDLDLNSEEDYEL